MSETSPESNQNQAKILDLSSSEQDPSYVCFSIGRDTRGADVMATLRYLNMDPEKLRTRVDHLLADGIDERGILDNGKISVKDPVGYVSDQLQFERVIQLGEKPTYAEIKEAFANIYGDDAPKYEEYLLEGLIDNGHYNGNTLRASGHNEIVTAQSDQIALEMEALTRKFGNDL